jgi:imidazole glycerol-phosphate synthase subunit HisF
MLKKRLVACLIIRDGLIVQSIGFNQYLPIGHPKFSVEYVARWDVDEIVLLDISATSENNIPDIELLKLLSRNSFVPLSVGGGIKSVEDVRTVLRSGADKVVINTHAINNPQLISEIADIFGSQCVIVSIDCKKEESGNYQVYSASGKLPSGLAPEDWAKTAEELGAGEILLNSIDRDGLKQGYDIPLIQRVCDSVSIPVVAVGGVGRYTDFQKGIIDGHASAVAASNIFHFIEHSTIVAKAHLLKSGIDIRLDSEANYRNREFDENGRLLTLSAGELSDIEFKSGKVGIL